MDTPDRTDTVHTEFVPWEVVDRGWPFRRGSGPLVIALAVVVVAGVVAVGLRLRASPPPAAPMAIEAAPLVTVVAPTTTSAGTSAISEAELMGGLEPVERSSAVVGAAEEALRRYFTVTGPDGASAYPEWVLVTGVDRSETGWSVRFRCSLLTGQTPDLVRLDPMTIDVEVSTGDGSYVTGMPVLVVDGPRLETAHPALSTVPETVAARSVALVSGWGSAQVVGGTETEAGWLVLVSIDGLPPVGVEVSGP